MSRRPNIVLIMSDDQGNWAMGCAGNKDIKTPNIDKLAETGVRFEHFYCASPVCSPARLSVFTGKMPSQHGVHDWIAEGHINESELSEDFRQKIKMDNPSWEYQWPKDQLSNAKAIPFLDGHQTFTQELANNGYTCGISGKWHMGDAGRPQCGFTYWKTIALGGDNYMYSTVLKNGVFDMEREKYVTDYITENAIDFINEQKDKEEPFYLSVHYTSPHSPWGPEHHPEQYINMYNDCEFNDMPNEKPHKWSGAKYDSEEHRLKDRKYNLRGFCAATTAMDKGIGDIISKLEKEGLRENTIIMFTADNGMSMGHHGIFGKGNGTFPMNMYDSAVEVPFIVSQPGTIEQGKVVSEMFSHYDIFQTLMDELNIPVEYEAELPGTSFSPVLHGETVEGRESVVIMDEYGPVRMIRTKEWKYIHRFGEFEGMNELYDLKNDPYETVNLLENNDYLELQSKLKVEMDQWFVKYSDPRYDGSALKVHGIGQVGTVSQCKKNDNEIFRLYSTKN